MNYSFTGGEVERQMKVSVRCLRFGPKATSLLALERQIRNRKRIIDS